MSCDQHVVKIQLEIVQMLYMAWHFAEQADYIEKNAPLAKDGLRTVFSVAEQEGCQTSFRRGEEDT